MLPRPNIRCAWGLSASVRDDMKTALNLALALLLLLTCSGCIPIPIPYYGVKRPGASGVVLDARSGQPVAAATVTMMNATNSYPYHLDKAFDTWPVVARVQTAPDGSYLIPPKRGFRIWLLMLMPDMPPREIHTRLLIEHPSYDRGERFFTASDYEAQFYLLPATPHLSPVYLNPSSN